ncbi:hypothetical protein FACS1894199_06090 [Bacteroidia bacterium]|nr:hypothetical protein FACS1894199_06090 [Bacteroidia bacterium]
MKVYHGSYTVIHEIDLSKGELQRDFGQGFYVTKYRDQAEFWAIRKGNRKHTDSVVTEFEFDENGYEDAHFKVLRFNGYTNDWFDFIIQNRQSSKAFHDYDIVEGPVADDKIQNRIQRFIEGAITREGFFSQLIHPKPSHQICFCTVNSLKLLKRNNAKITFKIEDIAEPLVEQLMLDLQIDAIQAADMFYSSATFTQLANPDTKLYEQEWQEIYQMLMNDKNRNNAK